MKVIAVIIMSLVASIAWADKWNGTIDDLSHTQRYILIGDNPFAMSTSMDVVSHQGKAISRYDLKLGQLVEVKYEYRNGKQTVTSLTVYPSNHVFPRGPALDEEDD